MHPMSDTSPLHGLYRIEAERFSHILTEGAFHAAPENSDPEIRLIILPSTIRSWSGIQATLMNHITIGAYAVIKQTNDSRWLYTTSRGTAQQATLTRWTNRPIELLTSPTYEDLQAAAETSLLHAMTNATSDGRSRRATPRGFDYPTAHAQRLQHQRFTRIADGNGTLPPEDLDEFLAWWDTTIDPRTKRMLGGLPVPPDIYRQAQQRHLTQRWNLTTTH